MSDLFLQDGYFCVQKYLGKYYAGINLHEPVWQVIPIAVHRETGLPIMLPDEMCITQQAIDNTHPSCVWRDNDTLFIRWQALYAEYRVMAQEPVITTYRDGASNEPTQWSTTGYRCVRMYANRGMGQEL